MTLTGKILVVLNMMMGYLLMGFAMIVTETRPISARKSRHEQHRQCDDVQFIAGEDRIDRRQRS